MHGPGLSVEVQGWERSQAKAHLLLSLGYGEGGVGGGGGSAYLCPDRAGVGEEGVLLQQPR